MPNRPINTARAMDLLKVGYSCAQAGKILACEEGRQSRYQDECVRRAVLRDLRAGRLPPSSADPLLDAIERAHGQGGAV